MRTVQCRGGYSPNDDGSFTVVIEVEGVSHQEAIDIIEASREPLRSAVIEITSKGGPFRVETKQ
ncbi:hypothetical protein [Bradyrhizobium sp. 2S1]|uniref:hypothetical protein n=1 Tax=Bradyrhizobium sp. 2S1 TaxID=1404429 RepID=UPI001408DECB|nr:hypothetical protein [Bradyrhizobium sp. 2S1]MCK7672421.1 hypothetical protein [Bradyrhizobium sp. 2S1]